MSEDGLRVIQISDFHLLADAGERLREVETPATLAAVIERVRAEAPDLVLATGDLSQDGLLGSYRRVKTLLRRLDAHRGRGRGARRRGRGDARRL